MNIAIQPVRFGKAAGEAMTPFQRANEERLNNNLRMLQEQIEALQKHLDSLDNGG